MNKDNIIELIERELVQADEAQSDADFEKHMYAIHTLTSLYTTGSSKSTKARDNTYNVASSFKKTGDKPNSSSKSEDISAAELQAMGAKIPSSMQQQSSNSTQSSKLTTDDNIGNGDSIFDF